jgi:hypothetical protein
MSPCLPQHKTHSIRKGASPSGTVDQSDHLGHHTLPEHFTEPALRTTNLAPASKCLMATPTNFLRKTCQRLQNLAFFVEHQGTTNYSNDSLNPSCTPRSTTYSSIFVQITKNPRALPSGNEVLCYIQDSHIGC